MRCVPGLGRPGDSHDSTLRIIEKIKLRVTSRIEYDVIPKHPAAPGAGARSTGSRSTASAM